MSSHRYGRFRIILIFCVLAAYGFLWPVGCGSDGGEQLDVGFDADVGLTDVDEDLANSCGGDDALLYEDVVVEPGDVCGACDDGTITCDGEDEVRCARAKAANECGGCEPLPGRAGTPCGPCESGTWACDGEGGMTCIDALEHNACGGCGDLDAQPTTGCQGVAGENGVWGCTGPDAVRCVLPGENACGGVLDLDSEPGTGCGTCDGGVWACESESDVICTNPDWGVNVCGGCDPLFGVLGDPCGVCDGEWACQGPDDVFCDESPRNACGGCTELGSSLPGQQCGPSAVYICRDEETLTCPQDGSNVCGGSSDLAHIPGDSCGDCGDGQYFCASSEALVCVGESSRNACQGCGDLDDQPGDACGPCGLDTVVCDGESSTVCDGSTPCPVLAIDTQSAGEVTEGSATFYGQITELPLDQVTDHGFCWAHQQNPTPVNGNCHSLGGVDDARSFEHTTDDLLAGRRYFVRAFATVGTLREYADDVVFTTAASTPGNIDASDGEHTDFVEISWTNEENADQYIIYRDGTEIATVDAADERFEDTEATAAGVPLAPQNVEATDGIFADHILVSWDHAASPQAPAHTYQVVAVYPDQTSELSAGVTGRRKDFDIETYELSIDGDDWFDIGLVDEYEDDEAPLATITPGTASASGGDYETHVALEQLDPPSVQSHPVNYRVRAINEAGDGDESQDAEGMRGVDDTLYYQWFFSDDGEPGTFNPLFSPATPEGDQYDDASAPADGSIRSYYLVVSAEGAAMANTNVVTGFRAASANISTEPVTAVTVDQATLRGNLEELGSPPPSQHGFCFGTMSDPTHGSGANCSELGNPNFEGVFEETIVGLSGGTTYFVRAYLTNSDGISYGGVVQFLTLSETPAGLVATSDTDHVALSWDGVTGANEYRIYRDGSEIATVTTTAYNDTGATEGSTANAPTLTATSGTHTDRVELSWNVPDIDDGPQHNYYVIAVNNGGDSEASNTIQGNRDAYPVTSYELQINGGAWSDVGNTTSDSDFDADAPGIDAGTASASDGESVDYVALSLDGTSTSPGADSTYRIRGINASGSGTASTLQDGYRDVDPGDLQYQWSYSDNGAAGPFASLESPSSNSAYNDQSAPDDGSIRHYFVTVSANGMPSQNSSVVSGFRAAEAQVNTNSPTDVGNEDVTLHAEITDLGAPEPTEHGFCYGTMADPTHGTGALCTTLGSVSATGAYQQVVTGLSPGTNYNVRAYATNDVDTFYGESVGFVTLSDAPAGLVATSHTDHVALSWDGVTGANEYRIYRDGSEIATVTTTAYNDTGATEGSTANAPTLTATSGTHTDRVELSWNVPDIDDGPQHNYYVIAVNNGGDSDPSNTAQGNRDAYPVTSYELQIDGGAWSDVGNTTSDSDFDADAPSIDAGTASASEDEFQTHVALELVGAQALAGDDSTYRIRAINQSGDGASSSQVNGHIGVGALDIEWQRTDENDPSAAYLALELSCVDQFQCDDTTAPQDGSTRYYRVQLDADGVDGPVTTDPPQPGSTSGPSCGPELFAGGDGTTGAPYQIETAIELNAIGDDENDCLDRSFIVTNTINLQDLGAQSFNIIGDEDAPFSGHFDGDERVIENLTIDEPETIHVGMFGYAESSAIIENVMLRDVNITGDNMVGGLVGSSQGTISNCSSTGSVNGDNHVGGLVGNKTSGSVVDSSSDTTVNGINYLGGLVGSNLDSASISQSFSSGEVIGEVAVGGLVGRHSSQLNSSITDSFATGSVAGDMEVGGLIGVMESTGTELINSYAAGTVVSTGTDIGGLIGKFDGQGTIAPSYWDIDVEPTNNGVGTPLQTAEFEVENNFDGWDFEETWVMGLDETGNIRPQLQWTHTCNEDQDCENGICENNICTLVEPVFVSMWDTDNGGESFNTQVELPLVESGSYDFTVDWGDGSEPVHITAWDQPEVTHSYFVAGVYQIEIRGQIEGWSFKGGGDARNLLEISQWGDLKLGNEGGYFNGARDLEITATDMLDLTGTTDLSSAFENCRSLTTIPLIEEWDVSEVTDMNLMFRAATEFNQDIGDWDVGNVTTMSQMFFSAWKFNQDISAWTVENVTSMDSMFSDAREFNQDISAWTVDNVTDMSRMFAQATNFNGDIEGWDVGAVTDMSWMFKDATSFNRDIGAWNVENVIDMNQMFNGATNFDRDIGGWIVSNVTDMERMFRDVTSFNQNIGGWDVGSVTSTSGMFRGATSFNQDIGAWNVENVTDMSTMFTNASAFNQDIGGWNTSSVETTFGMFTNAVSFDQDLGGWDISSIQGSGFGLSMSSMFSGVALSTENYDSLLNGWATQQNVPDDVMFDGGNSQYSEAAEDSRNILINDFEWSIDDGGLAD